MPVAILRPLAVGDYDQWQLYAGATKMAAVDSGSPVAHDDFTSYIRLASGGAGFAQSFTLFNKPQFLGAITSLKLGVRLSGCSQCSIKFERFMRLGSTDGSTIQNIIGDGTTNLDALFITYQPVEMSRPGGGSWTASDITNGTLQMVIRHVDAPNIWFTQVTTMWVELTYDASDQIFAEDLIARGIGSRRLFAQRRATPLVQVTVPWEFMDVELLDDLVATHDAGPVTPSINTALVTYTVSGDPPAQINAGSQGGGWGYEDWSRGYLRLWEQSIDFETMTMTVKLEDKRRRNVWFWNTLTNESSARGIFDGVAQLPANIEIEYDRNSLAWVEGPSGQVVAVNTDSPKYSPNGLILEPGATNYVLNSSFADGLSGWTQEGVGLNGATIALDTDKRLFDAAVTPNTVKLTAGNPLGGTDIALSQALASLATGSYTWSTDYENALKPDGFTGRLRFRAQRSSDSRWLNDVGGWQVGIATIDGNFGTGRKRHKIGFILTATDTVTIRMLANESAGQIHWVKHVQVEKTEWATERMVTSAAATFTRAAETASFPNDSGLRLFPVEQGTLFLSFLLQSGNDDGESGFTADKVLLQVHATSGDHFRLFFDVVPDGNLIARFNIGATNYDAVVYRAMGNLSKTRQNRIAVRWTGAIGELGLTARTVSVFIDSVFATDPAGLLHILKGNDVVLPSAMSEPNPSDLLLTPDATLIAGAYISNIEITPFVLTDDEILGMLVG